MKKCYAFALAALMASPVLADESFGGVGITIVPAREGIRVVEVIPGSPAAEAGIESKDRICAVDGIKLSPNDFEGSKNALRGTVGKPVEVSVIRDGDTLSVTIRRSHLRLKDVSKESLQNWYGEDAEAFTEQDVAVVAEQGASSNEKLLAVLDYGRAVKEKSNGEAVTAVFVESEQVFDKGIPQKKQAPKRGTAKLRGINRSTIAFSAKTAGNVRVVVTDANGQVFENKLVSANAGANTVNWNGSAVPSGRYSVTLEQDGTTSTYVARVK